MAIFSPPDANAKLAKSADSAYYNIGLSLAQADTSGYEVCASRSPGCTIACVGKGGLASVFKSIGAARIARTRLFFEHRDEFLSRMFRELRRYRQKAIQLGKRLACRLNAFSDIMWERVCPSIFTYYPDVVFYDYTKHYRRMQRYCKRQFPANYHLTYSRSEINASQCDLILRLGGNVSVVFESKDLRAERIATGWNGFPVVDGDKTDLRFLDGINVICGLYAKGTLGRADSSGFVVRGLALPVV